MCDLSDADTCEVWSTSERTAQKPHRCDCCACVIRRGARYVREFSIFCGEVGTAKWCAGCARDRAAFGEAHRFYPAADSFPETLRECIDEGDAEGKVWRPALARVLRRTRRARQQSQEVAHG